MKRAHSKGWGQEPDKEERADGPGKRTPRNEKDGEPKAGTKDCYRTTSSRRKNGAERKYKTISYRDEGI